MTEVTGNISQQKQPSTEQQQDFTDLLRGLDLSGLTQENLDARLDAILRRVADHFHAEHGYLMLPDSEGQLQSRATINSGDSATASSALTGKVVTEAAPVIVTDAMNSDEFPGDPEFQRFNIGTAMCAPIITSDSQPGVIYFDSLDANAWNRKHLEKLEFVGRHVGLAIPKAGTEGISEENRRLIAAGRATLNLSHSVKNILQMIGGAAEVVDFGLRTNQIHRVKRSWDILKPNLERMRKFTLELLDYSKERRLNLAECDFNRVIQGAIESLKSQLKQKNSKINIRVDPRIPTIELDGERIHEMALNIILNAIDIVDDTGGLVSVETKYHQEKKQVSLSITDNGPGISDEMKEKIFTPFESKKKGFGTGLGMPIAKQIIDQHNGTIDIDSLPARGTVFTIHLPANVIETPQQ
jgi:signal transduction histidine kinase